MKFQLKTDATMKPYNNKKWWIDSGIVGEILVDAENIQKALEQYAEAVREKYYIDISKNALKNKEPIYRDSANGEPTQCGYIITAKTDFNNDYQGWVSQYIDLWVTVAVVVNPFAEAKLEELTEAETIPLF